MDIITELATLSEPSEQLTFIDKEGSHKEEGQKIISEIRDAMEKDPTILALSAPQLGIKKRIFGVRFEDKIKIFINPVVTKKSDVKIGIETCASMPGKEILIARPESVTAIYTNEDFVYEDNKFTGYAARIFDQQENILNGVMPNELGLVSDIEEDGSFSELPEEDVAKVLEIYKQFIAAKSASMAKAISEDETLKSSYKQMKFAEDVINGRTQVIENPNDEKKPFGNRKQRRALAKTIKRANSKDKQKADAKKGKK